MSESASDKTNSVATTQQDAALQGTVGDGDQYLTFTLGDEEYGVDILRVQEIRAWDTATPIPNTPPYVKGVINMRGTIVPVVDLRERFGMETLEYTQFTVVVLVKVIHGNRERIMGLIVDALSEVYGINEDQLRPPPEFGTVIRTDFIRGLATMEDKMVIVLDVDSLLGEDAGVGGDGD
ncbi:MULTISPECIES: chemotaxis protein CheW [Gammaproteobacteria]|jgi:purine-binding chemotaxis protein CheW|uniref:Chemotaxis protein CheW n=1 Tax=Vreelandella halophila TaxID=86177 RepID=A0A9X5B5V1_9GAMM|nr:MULTISPECIES: chemotaxis protein CheW [Gammaproteobacteria]KAA8980762.1 purine-binding chemotaxis protein CheW [Halospina sp. K52047b]MYL26577.1 chemotaxis protein CheW [Halomonas utahensis]MYL73914.1 chemotaxis protein CheW [Halomonas sp. 22501_18_FS]